MKRFIPDATPSGGTPFGASYVGEFAACPRSWFNTYLRPGVDEHGQPTKGIRPRSTPEFLPTGSIFHAMLGEWYTSGCRDGEDTGEYSLDRAIAVGEAARDGKEGEEYESREVAAEQWEILEPMMVSYHDTFGPGGPHQDYPKVKVLCDGNGEPLVERPWTCTLTDGYIYTCRTDLVVLEQGFVSVWEHKTATQMPVFLRMRKESIPWDAQFTGEYWILKELFAHVEPIHRVMVNRVFKKHVGVLKSGKDSAHPLVAEREPTDRTDGQLEQWRWSTIHELYAIDEAVERFNRGVASGNTSIEHVAALCFPQRGTRTGRCTAYRGCAYQGLCRWAGNEERVMKEYRVQSNEELVSLREWAS